MVNFTVSRDDNALIMKIVGRAMGYTAIAQSVSRQELAMDLTAVHANGCPLRLAELLKADEMHFGHDIMGIRRHLDRTTGKLGGHFMPRYAAAQGKEQRT